MFKLPSVLYHGTTSTHQSSLFRIDITKCREGTDFGQGFYLTDNDEQALEWAKKQARVEQRRAKKKNPLACIDAIVIAYNVDNNYISKNTKGKIFEEPNDDWATFVYNNRMNTDWKHLYDYVAGPMADGGVAILMEQRIREQVTFETFRKKIQPAFGSQFSFHNSETVNKCLAYREVRERVYVQG